MSDISNIAVSTQAVVVAINGLTKAIQNLAFKAPSETASSIGTAAAAGQGTMRFVTDASSTIRLSVYAGGGANKVMVYSDGANWIIL